MIRSPIITILGHVDHGKTTLLDYIRKSHVTEKEHGGITQKIGGYEIDTHIKGYPVSRITFIDTPGHEAFSKLRARGANVADIAILIIDAKDSIMPQTIESISHIKSANIPFIVALNKVDLPEANPEKVKNDLLKYEIAVEGKGGNVPIVNISAKKGTGINDLLEMILFIASEMNLKYEVSNPFKGYIIETKKDRNGIMASIIIKEGELKVGDIIYNEGEKIKVKAIFNDLGESLSHASPSTPVEISGFSELPKVGSMLTTEPQAEKIVEKTGVKKAEFNINSLFEKKIDTKKISIIIKTDSQGSLEAISNALSKNENLEIILKAVGDIHKSDIFLAKTTSAIVIGFNIFITNEVKDLAKQEKVIIKTYKIIYELLDELNEVAALLQEKEAKEKSAKGEAKILANFIIEGEKIYGVKVTKGKINLGDQIELYRGINLINKTRLVSLKTRAKTVNEVKKDQEAGMIFSPPIDISMGDMIKSIS